MDAVNRNIHLLLNSIQKSDVYRTYKKQEAILEKNPELVSRVQHFRSDNFRLQNEERGNLLQDAEQLARESAELRRNPEVNAYLDAELALCRMMQQICKTLTDGIEIKVQPPGKQLKTITLLSGGEKAFVAIALYFAILKVHPTPFCVMDEIEAALDEANVVRYARYMRRIAGKTQFIVITHRRGTMEEADVLYGVTMQERGGSRILTINLNDMAKELNIK